MGLNLLHVHISLIKYLTQSAFHLVQDIGLLLLHLLFSGCFAYFGFHAFLHRERALTVPWGAHRFPLVIRKTLIHAVAISVLGFGLGFAAQSARQPPPPPENLGACGADEPSAQIVWVEIEQGYAGKKPRTRLRLTTVGRSAVEEYRGTMEKALKNLAG